MQISNSVFSLVILSILPFSWGYNGLSHGNNVPTAGKPALPWDTPPFPEACSETQSEKLP